MSILEEVKEIILDFSEVGNREGVVNLFCLNIILI